MAVGVFESLKSYFEVTLLAPLILYTIGLVLFGFFIWHFYRYLAKRDILGFDIHKYNTFQDSSAKKIFKTILHIIEFVFLVPILTFFWFFTFTIFIIILSEEQSVSSIILIAMSIVAATRVISYFNEDLAREMAKTIPITILAIFIIDPNIVSIDTIIQRVSVIPNTFDSIIYYALFTIILEFILRAYYSFKHLGKEDSGTIKEEYLIEENVEQSNDEENDDASKEEKAEEDIFVEEHIKEAEKASEIQWKD